MRGGKSVSVLHLEVKVSIIQITKNTKLNYEQTDADIRPN